MRGTAGNVPHVKCGRSGFHDDQHGTGTKVPTGMPTGCHVYAHDYDVGVVVRLELGVICAGLGLNVKRAEVGLVTASEPPPPSVQRGGGGAGGVVEPAFAANPYAGVGHNDPCPCGSGKKFKKCHGAAA